MESPEIIDVAETTTAVIAATVPMAELPNFFDQAFPLIAQALGEQGVAPAGPAFARYHGMPAETVSLEVGFPVATAIEASGDTRPGTLPAGRVAHAVHAGGFDGLGDSWGQLQTWIGEQGATPGPQIWEVYVTEPSPDMDPADLRTELFWVLL